MGIDSKYKSIENTLTNATIFSNVLLESRFGVDVELLGVRIEVTSGTLDSLDFFLESKSDTVGDVYSKAYPFFDADTVFNSEANIIDIPFLSPIKISSGGFVKLLGENLTGMTGSETLNVSLYYI